MHRAAELQAKPFFFGKTFQAKVMDSPTSQYDTILILDFGSQYTHIIARRVRELNVYSEIQPYSLDVKKELKYRPKGIILSGGPASVYDATAPHVDASLWDLDVPVLGICYGLQELATVFGGEVKAGTHREYGHAQLTHNDAPETMALAAKLFADTPSPSGVWMSHGDQISRMPNDFVTIATTSTAPHAAVAHRNGRVFGLQFHPEVTHSTHGATMLRNFVRDVCGAKATWTMGSFVDLEIARLQALIPADEHVVGAVSGGVDSTVAAKLMHLAIGSRFHAVFVDNGLLRKDERQRVEKSIREQLNIPLHVVDASELFLARLAGVVDPERKRTLIGHTFIEVFEAEAAKLHANIAWLLQGTLYPDVIESKSAKGGPSVTIKTHHNVGGLLADMRLAVVEPLRELFKDEVRHLGALLGIPRALLARHPFPGPALAIRILGEVTLEQLDMLREADRIFIEEIRAAGLYDAIAQAFAVLLPVRSVGVMGDGRTYEQVVCLRAVESSDFMTADWFAFPDALLRKCSSRIINEVRGINRVVYDISSKPPATIEWE